MTGRFSNLDCRNPECSAPFNFRQGRFFRFYGNHPKGDTTSMNHYFLKHLWLCKHCTEIYTLEYQEGTASLISLTPSKPFSAAAYPESSPLGGETSLHPSGEARKARPSERWNITRKAEVIDEVSYAMPDLF
jgi:hypothetical protein